MVNVIDNGARNRTNMMPVGIKIIDDKGDVAHTAKTDLGTNYISLESKWFGSSSNNTGGGNTGGNSDTTPAGTDTSGGVNIIPGSLDDGSITSRRLEWSGTTSTTEATNITFMNDVGLNLNQVGDGLQFWGHMQRIKVTDGVKADADIVPLNFDPKNVKKNDYYTTTSPIPFSISRDKLPTAKKVTITLNGVGEGLDNIVDHVSPTISFTFNQDKTLTVLPTEGHDLDAGTKDDTGTVKTNGAFYTFVLDYINNYSIQDPIAQLSPSVNLFSGSASGEIALSGANEFFDNVMDGLEITFDPLLHTNIVDKDKKEVSYNLTDIGVPTSIKVPKAKLIENFEFNGFDKLTPTVLAVKNPIHQTPGYLQFLGYSANTIKILKNAITVNIAVKTSQSSLNNLNDSSYGKVNYTFLVTKITPYKN